MFSLSLTGKQTGIALCILPPMAPNVSDKYMFRVPLEPGLDKLEKNFGASQVVVVDLSVMILLPSQVIRVAFYTEHEKSDKFCSKALISA